MIANRDESELRADARAAASQPDGNAGRRVLVVEDEMRLREMLGRAVRDMDFQIDAVPSAEAAIRHLEERPVDILIVDLNLPGMGGLEFLEIVRRRWADIQPIILTGFGDLNSAKRAIQMDAVDFLTKPCPLGDLEVALERARQRRMARFPAAALPNAGAPPDPLPREPAQAAAKPLSSPGYEPLSLEEVEKRHILATLEKNNGNRTQTAQELGISLRKLYYRLGQYQREDASEA